MDKHVIEERRIDHGPGLPGVVKRQQSWWRRPRVLVLGMASCGLLLGGCGIGARTGALPSVSVQVGGPEGGDSMSVGVQLLLLLTVLSLVPAILMMVTSFIRIAIVLSFARSAIGMQQMPPDQILLGLALFLPIFVMAPIWTSISEDALQPYLDCQISLDDAIDRGSTPLRSFMLKQTRERDLALFVALGKLPRPNAPDDLPTYVLIPSFMIREHDQRAEDGLPDGVPDPAPLRGHRHGRLERPDVDGHDDAPPAISLPFKVLLFVMADGWYLITRSLVTSFTG